MSDTINTPRGLLRGSEITVLRALCGASDPLPVRALVDRVDLSDASVRTALKSLTARGWATCAIGEAGAFTYTLNRQHRQTACDAVAAADSPGHRVGVFYDAGWWTTVTGYYRYHHPWRARITFTGIHDLITWWLERSDAVDAGPWTVVEAHYIAVGSLPDQYAAVLVDAGIRLHATAAGPDGPERPVTPPLRRGRDHRHARNVVAPRAPRRRRGFGNTATAAAPTSPAVGWR